MKKTIKDFCKPAEFVPTAYQGRLEQREMERERCEQQKKQKKGMSQEEEKKEKVVPIAQMEKKSKDSIPQLDGCDTPERLQEKKDKEFEEVARRYQDRLKQWQKERSDLERKQKEKLPTEEEKRQELARKEEKRQQDERKKKKADAEREKGIKREAQLEKMRANNQKKERENIQSWKRFGQTWEQTASDDQNRKQNEAIETANREHNENGNLPSVGSHERNEVCGISANNNWFYTILESGALRNFFKDFCPSSREVPSSSWAKTEERSMVAQDSSMVSGIEALPRDRYFQAQR